jgi:hypothetical protein
MSVLSLRLPESLHEKVRELAERDDVSINQFIALAVAEKTSALLTSEYLAERGRRGSRAKFDRVLSKVRDVPPDPGDDIVSDKIDDETTTRTRRASTRRSPGKRTPRDRRR